jgi:hypothetical protein
MGQLGGREVDGDEVVMNMMVTLLDGKVDKIDGDMVVLLDGREVDGDEWE